MSWLEFVAARRRRSRSVGRDFADSRGGQAVTTDWFELNRSVRPDGLEASDEYVFYQMLTGSWPLDDDPRGGDNDYADRMVA